MFWLLTLEDIVSSKFLIILATYISFDCRSPSFCPRICQHGKFICTGPSSQYPQCRIRSGEYSTKRCSNSVHPLTSDSRKQVQQRFCAPWPQWETGGELPQTAPPLGPHTGGATALLGSSLDWKLNAGQLGASCPLLGVSVHTSVN